MNLLSFNCFLQTVWNAGQLGTVGAVLLPGASPQEARGPVETAPAPSVAPPRPAADAAALLQSAVDDHAIHGGLVLAGNLTEDLDRVTVGYADAAHRFPMRRDTVIDIASCTKVSATITGLLIEHSRGRIDFDAPFTDYLPEYTGTLKQKITVRQLANHRSGFYHMPGESPRCYFDESGMKILENVLRLSPPCPPPDVPKYACWNYILLAKVLEHVSGMPFDRFCEQEIFAPLGMTSSSVGAPRPGLPKSRLAQTFGTPEAGRISDFIAFRIYRDGGTTGNAGMFSTAEDLAKLLRCYLRGGEYGDGKRLFGPREIAEILPDRRQKVNGYRRFGWIVWDDFMSDSEFGETLLHSGWSGQTILLCPRRNFFVIVLTTRCGGDYDRAKRDRFTIIRDIFERESARAD